MFQRREKKSIWAKIRGIIWPRMGWMRTFSYFWHRLQRIPGTSSSIAAGFACGAAASMTPFYGTHILSGALLAWAIRGNIIASILGAQIANPWTAPPLWFAAYYVGAWMLGIDIAEHPPNFVHMFKGLTEAVLHANMKMFVDSVWPVFGPMTLGSIPLGLIVGFGFYFALEPVLKTVQTRRAMRMQRKQVAAHAAIPPAGADV